MTDAIVYIPTYRRVNRQVTLAQMSPFWRERTWLVSPTDECESLRKIHPRVLACDEPGIGPTRQWILDYASESMNYGHPQHLILMDDDLRFYKRRDDDPGKFLQIHDAEDFDLMMGQFLYLFDGSPLIGISNRSGANRLANKGRYLINARMHDLFGIHVPTAVENGFRIDRVRFMEDFDFILQHLNAGYETRVLNSYCKGDYGSNAPGGCSSYRDHEGQALAALDLAMLWPEVVKVVEKQTKGSGMWSTRTDVNISWKKAYKG